jgi:two-component system, cell cycle sensor histidine kinase and response regulator CckA
LDSDRALATDDIKEHPSYVCNQLALRLGVIGSSLVALANLGQPAPNNFYLAGSTGILAVIFFVFYKLILPRVVNHRQLDLVVLAYMLPILTVQWYSIWCNANNEVSAALGGMMVMTGLLFNSTVLAVLTATLMAINWMFWKSYFGSALTVNEQLQLLVAVPIIAAVARLATARSITLLYRAKRREQATVLELLATLSQLKEQTKLREKSEAQLLRSQKNESLGLMAAGVAHDFNNMLSAINAFADVIQLRADDAMIKSHAKDIGDAVNQAAAICRQMLIYAGKTNSQMSAVDLNAITQELKPLLQASSAGRITVDVTTDIEQATVFGNATQLKQVLLNLVTNGAESIEGTGKVHIRIFRHKVSELDSAPKPSDQAEFCTGVPPPGEYVALAVSDNGRGMPLEIVRQIFDPYFTTKGSGHGFGLSVVDGIAKSHHATIDVRSRPSFGTTVAVLFPKVAAAFEAKSLVRSNIENANQTNGQPILLVDDDPLVRNSIAKMLASQGWNVIKAESGEAAIQCFEQSHKFSAIIIDFNMPHMNGRQTLNKLREMGCISPAILISGTECQQADDHKEFAAFLPKPFLWKDLDSLLGGVTRPQSSN